MAHLLTVGFLKPTGDTAAADAEARLYLDIAIMMHDSPEAMVYLANMSFTPENQKRKWLAEAAARLDYPPVRSLDIAFVLVAPDARSLGDVFVG